MITTESPKTNPLTMGLDRNSAIHPVRSSPATSRIIPDSTASATVRAIARSGSPPALAATIEPDTTDTVDTGPTLTWGEDPSRA